MAEKQDDGTYVEEVGNIPFKDTHITKTEFLAAKEDVLSEGQPKLQVIRENWKVCVIIAIMQLNGMVMGMEYSLLGALVGVQSFCKTMGSYDATAGDYAVAAWALSLWGGMFGLTQFGGQLWAGWVADKWGRRVAIGLMTINLIGGVILEICSANRDDWTGAKIIMGSGTGALQVVIPVTVAEFTPREIRGITVGLFSFNLSLGSLVGTLVIWACNNRWPGADENNGWKVPLYCGLAAPILSGIAMFFILPESPYWLVMHNRVSDAANSLRRLHPNKPEHEIERMTNELAYTVTKEAESRKVTQEASYMECFRGPNLRRTFSAMFPSLAQQIIGNQLVQSYSTYFFEIANFDNSLLGSVIVSIVGLFGAIVAFFIIEAKSVGRWPCVFYGVVGITVAMFGVGITATADPGTAKPSAGIALVFFLAFYNFMVAIGPGVAGWAYAGEAGSARLRAKTTTLATGANAIIGTITNIVIPYELDAIGSLTGWMFGGLGVFCCVAVWLWIPEVRGRSYAQLDEMFEKRIPAREFKNYTCTGEYGADVVYVEGDRA